MDKIAQIYSGKIEEYAIQEDARFEKLMEMLHRSNTALKANSNLLEHENKKVEQYMTRRHQRKNGLDKYIESIKADGPSSSLRNPQKSP